MDISYFYILLGSIFTLCIQALLIFILFTSFKRTIKSSKQYKNINIKKENDSKERDIMLSNLRNVMLDIYKSSTKESCNWFRVLIERMFIQARFSSIFKTRLKKIMLDRLKKQFERLYWVHRFIIIDIDIGEKTPKVNSIRMIGLHDACQTEELEMEMDISYEGGLNFTLEIFILGGLMIPIRIDLNELHGPLRVRIPSCRYQGRFDVSFIKDPGFKFSVNASIVLLGESKKSTESDRAIPLQQMLVQFLAKKLRSIAINLWVMPSWRSFSLPMMNPSDKVTPSWTPRYQDHNPRSLPQIIIDSPSLANMDDPMRIKHMKSIFTEEFIAYLTSTSSYYPNHPMWHLVKKSKHIKNSKQSVIALYKMPLAQKITLYRGCFVLPIPPDSVKQFIRTEQVSFVFSDQMAGTSILAEMDNEIRIKECHIQLKKNQDTRTLHFLEGWYTNYKKKKKKNISLEWAVFYHSLSSSTPETPDDPISLEELSPESYDNKPSSPWIVFGYGVELIPESHEYVLLVMSMTLDHAQPSSLVKRFELDWNCLAQLYDQFVRLYHESVVSEPKAEQSMSKSQPILSIDHPSQILLSSDPVISRSLSFKSIKRKQSIGNTKAIVKDYLVPSLSVASKWIKSLSHTVMHPRLALKASNIDNSSHIPLIKHEKNDTDTTLDEPESNEPLNLLDYLSKDFCSLRTLLLAPSLDNDRIQCLLNIESSETTKDEIESLSVSLMSFTLEEIQSIYHSTDQDSLKFIRSSHGFKIYKQERTNNLILISKLSLKYMKNVVEYLVDYENRLDLVTKKMKDMTKNSAIIHLPFLCNSYKYHFKDLISKNSWVLESIHNQDNDIEFTLAIDIQNDDSSFYVVIQLSPILFSLKFSLSEFIQYIMTEQITYKLGFKYILDELWRNEYRVLDIQCNQVESSNNPSEYIHHLTALDFHFPFSSISNIAFNLSWTIKSTTDIPVNLSIKHHRDIYDDELSILPYNTYKLHPTASHGHFLLLVPCLIKSGPLLTLTLTSQKQPSISYKLHIEPINESKLDCFAPKQLIPYTIYSINTTVSIKSKKIYIIEFPISILHSHKNNPSINWEFNTDKNIMFSIYHSLDSDSLSDSDYSSKRFIIPFNLKSSITTGSLPLYPFTNGTLCFIWKNPAAFTSRQLTINLELSH